MCVLARRGCKNFCRPSPTLPDGGCQLGNQMRVGPASSSGQTQARVAGTHDPRGPRGLGAGPGEGGPQRGRWFSPVLGNKF